MSGNKTPLGESANTESDPGKTSNIRERVEALRQKTGELAAKLERVENALEEAAEDSERPKDIRAAA
ncbi:MAG TPA: hypothetical protein VM940_02635 [Chthoniobacterales bacterium]|jgi:multidrug resistance efflux pump|nr:hypothetical protein [Chthoniobacterales bacterium]